MERTMIADELTDDELAELDTMEDTLTWYDIDPSDIELARRDAMIERGYLNLAALIAGVTVGLLVLVAGLTLFTGDVQAQEPSDKIYGAYPINGRIYEYPYIGTPEYSASCTVYRAYEDGYAEAFCSEDGGTYRHDPETETWSPMTNAH